MSEAADRPPRRTRPIRVAILSAMATPVGGWGVITHEFCSHLTQVEGIDFTLHLPVSEPRERGLHESDGAYSSTAYAERIRRDLPPFSLMFEPRTVHVLIQQFRQLEFGGIDLIHTLVEPYAITAWWHARKLRRPYVILSQGTYAVRPFHVFPGGMFFRRAFRDAAAIIAPSQYTANSLKRASGRVRKVYVLHNAVNFARFQRRFPVPSLLKGLGSSPQIVLSVGIFRPRKGFDILVRAHKLVVAASPDAHLVLVGPGNSAPLRSLARDLGLEHRVHMVEPQDQDGVAAYLQSCDVFALTPRRVGDSFEGFGIVFLEAGACGKPVVASNSGGVADAVVDGATGLLVPEEDPEATAVAITKLLRNKDLAKRLGEQGRIRAAQHDWNWYCSEIVTLYEKVVYGEDRVVG